MDAGTRYGYTPVGPGWRGAEIAVPPPEVHPRHVAPPTFSALIIFAGCAYATAYFLFKFIRGDKVWNIKKGKFGRRRKPVTLALALMIQGWVAFAGLNFLTPFWYSAALWVGAGVTLLLLFGIWRVSVFDEHRKANNQRPGKLLP